MTNFFTLAIEKIYYRAMCMETVANRLADARKESGLNKSELARKAGCKYQVVQGLEKGKQTNSKYLPGIARALGVNLTWLMHGEGRRYANDNKTDKQSGVAEYPLLNVGLLKVPVIGSVAAGVWVEQEEEQEPIEFIPFHTDRYPHADLFALKVSGTSMNLEYAEGEILVCVPKDAGIETRNGDHVIVERHREQGGLKEVTVKELQIAPDGSYSLVARSSDPKWANTTLTLSNGSDDTVEAFIKGKVIASFRHRS